MREGLHIKLCQSFVKIQFLLLEVTFTFLGFGKFILVITSEAASTLLTPPFSSIDETILEGAYMYTICAVLVYNPVNLWENTVSIVRSHIYISVIRGFILETTSVAASRLLKPP